MDKGEINTIVSEVRGMMEEDPPKDKEVFLSGISSILCVFDTDVAIKVMEEFGVEGDYQALAIRVNHGY